MQPLVEKLQTTKVVALQSQNRFAGTCLLLTFLQYNPDINAMMALKGLVLIIKLGMSPYDKTNILVFNCSQNQYHNN